MTTNPRHRRWATLRGSPTETRRQARDLVAALADDDVLWVTDTPDEVDAHRAVRHDRVRRLLGGAFDAVVLDLHRQFDADVVGQSHGLVWGGGALVFRMPPPGEHPDNLRDGLAAHPYGPDDVGTRFWDRFERIVDAPDHANPESLVPPPHDVSGTDEQAAAVRQLTDLLGRDDAPTAALVADRGRGKSSALGMAIRLSLDARPDDENPCIAVTARYPDAAGEVFEFAGGDAPEAGPVQFVTVDDLLAAEDRYDAVVVDEAAQLAVPALRRLVERFPDIPLVFSSTTHGYEGTGRGFEVRFVDWLAERERPHETLRLEQPIRWEADDLLESVVFDALLLDAEPAAIDDGGDLEEASPRRLDRDQLVDDETRLRQYFGLLVRAHYRTTPRDLHRMLDAPNLHLHALVDDGDVVAATWAAEEGRLPSSIAEDVYWGRRIRGHALPEILLGNLARREAGDLEMIRSVRTAVHPDLRRRGLGTRLIAHVHDTYDPDLFGTVFGATSGVVAFRRAVGHEIVRMSPSRGARAGEPSVTMMRPASESGRRLFRSLRAEFARKLPIQLDLMRADGRLDPEPSLKRALAVGLPDAPPSLSDERIRQLVVHFADGPATYESAAFVVEPFVERHADTLDDLDDDHRELVDARVRHRRSWTDTAEAASQPTVRAAMRALRRAIRRLVELAEPEWLP